MDSGRRFGPLAARISGRYKRMCAQLLARRPFVMRNSRPVISFTFDDFPRSALLEGGTILERFGARGTYYTSFGLMAQDSPTGPLFHNDDIQQVFERGHELGCHTYSHCDAGITKAEAFDDSIVKNQQALNTLLPNVTMATLSFPIGIPSPAIKRTSSRHFVASRAGGQKANVGTIDLNYLGAFFIEQSPNDFGFIQQLIDTTIRENGWLIFATHDVCEKPTRFGCTPAFFNRIADYSVASGASLLRVSDALKAVGALPQDSATQARPV